MKSRAAAKPAERFGFLEGQVRHDGAAEAGGRRLFEKRLGTAAVDETVRDHRDERRVLHGERAHGGEDILDVHAALQGARVRRLDYRTVGDGIAVGKADLQQMRAVVGQRAREPSP